MDAFLEYIDLDLMETIEKGISPLLDIVRKLLPEEA